MPPALENNRVWSTYIEGELPELYGDHQELWAGASSHRRLALRNVSLILRLMNIKGSLPASVARREYLRAAVDAAFVLDIAGLAGANKPFFSTNLEPVTVLEPLASAAAFLTSATKCKNWRNIEWAKYPYPLQALSPSRSWMHFCTSKRIRYPYHDATNHLARKGAEKPIQGEKPNAPTPKMEARQAHFWRSNPSLSQIQGHPRDCRA